MLSLLARADHDGKPVSQGLYQLKRQACSSDTTDARNSMVSTPDSQRICQHLSICIEKADPIIAGSAGWDNPAMIPTI